MRVWMMWPTRKGLRLREPQARALQLPYRHRDPANTGSTSRRSGNNIQEVWHLETFTKSCILEHLGVYQFRNKNNSYLNGLCLYNSDECGHMGYSFLILWKQLSTFVILGNMGSVSTPLETQCHKYPNTGPHGARVMGIYMEYVLMFSKRVEQVPHRS